MSNVGVMQYIFSGASAFNQDLSGWDVSSSWNMNGMFVNASSFSDKDLSGWDVDYTDDARTLITHTPFSTGWGSGNTEPNWVD